MGEVRHLVLGFYTFRLFRYSYFHVAIGLVYFQSVGLTLSQALSLESVYYVSKATFDIPGGYFADRVGRKPSLIISGLLCALAYMIIGTNETYLVFAGAEILLGLAMSMAITSDSALLFDELKELNAEDQYQKAEGRGWALRNLGFGVAAAIGSWIAAQTTLGMPFLMSAGGISIASVIAIFYIKEPNFKPTLGGKLWYRDVVVVLKKPSFLPIVLFFAVMFIAVRIGFWAFQPVIEKTGTDLAWFGVLFGITLLVSLCSAISIGWVSKTYLAPWGAITSVLSFCFFVIAAGVSMEGQLMLIVVMAGFCIHAVGQGIYDPIMRERINGMSSGSVRATMMSVAIMLGNLGFAAFAPIYGYCLENYGHFQTLISVGVVILILGVSLSGWIRASQKRERIIKEAKSSRSYT